MDNVDQQITFWRGSHTNGNPSWLKSLSEISNNFTLYITWLPTRFDREVHRTKERKRVNVSLINSFAAYWYEVYIFNSTMPQQGKKPAMKSLLSSIWNNQYALGHHHRFHPPNKCTQSQKKFYNPVPNPTNTTEAVYIILHIVLIIHNYANIIQRKYKTVFTDTLTKKNIIISGSMAS